MLIRSRAYASFDSIYTIGGCERLGIFAFEDKIKMIPIGAKRRRGALGKTFSALIYQTKDIQEEEEVFLHLNLSQICQLELLSEKKKQKGLELTEESD